MNGPCDRCAGRPWVRSLGIEFFCVDCYLSEWQAIAPYVGRGRPVGPAPRQWPSRLGYTTNVCSNDDCGASWVGPALLACRWCVNRWQARLEASERRRQAEVAERKALAS